ncbi:hypothetical protein [Halorhodospira halochloris]|uniref:hypothetical protein n=1 Tax=Halorhodospira halochloris TaxID=1052 RepID=UPI001EE86E23|nr:hypothetical protein [Halorhodospira halochloris]MCG5549595.1 hypothetical protein [Halorhodospira halochloris]
MRYSTLCIAAGFALMIVFLPSQELKADVSWSSWELQVNCGMDAPERLADEYTARELRVIKQNEDDHQDCLAEAIEIAQ